MLKEVTNNFNNTEGTLSVDDRFITSNVIDVLKRYYKEVILEKDNIFYKEKVKNNE